MVDRADAFLLVSRRLSRERIRFDGHLLWTSASN
jgi:hypothetical protein